MATDDAVATISIQHEGRHYQGRGTGEDPDVALQKAVQDIRSAFPNSWRRDLLANGEDTSHLSDVRRARHSPNPDDRYA